MEPRISSEAELLDYLDQNHIGYLRIEHEPVYTCEQADAVRPPMPAVHTKNLFLRDEKQSRFFLVLTACEKRLDLKALGRALGIPKLHFASEEQLSENLGVLPGAVTVLGLVNDPQGRVELLVDADYWPAEAYLCHPLVNTATLVIQGKDLQRFFDLTGHTPRIVEMPGRP